MNKKKYLLNEQTNKEMEISESARANGVARQEQSKGNRKRNRETFVVKHKKKAFKKLTTIITPNRRVKHMSFL